MTYDERKSLVKSYLGKIVTIKIDRPIGYVHQKKNYTLIYPINYGFIPGVLGGDGEELDVYLLGVDIPLSEFTGKIIGIVHRHNDVEDKLVMAGWLALIFRITDGKGGVACTGHLKAPFEVQFILHFLAGVESVPDWNFLCHRTYGR